VTDGNGVTQAVSQIPGQGDQSQSGFGHEQGALLQILRTAGVLAAERSAFHEDAALEFEWRPVSLRYEGLPGQVELTVPTAEAFVAMKMAAFRERQERAICSMAPLARVVQSPRTRSTWSPGSPRCPASPTSSVRCPATAHSWYALLAHQVSELPAEEEALHFLREAVEGAYP
jgi:hypothetical protein